MKRALATVLIAASVAACGVHPMSPRASQNLAGARAAAGHVSGVRGFANPVIDTDFPDPCVMQATDGCYYAYATQGGFQGHVVNIDTARSSDLVHWQRLEDSLPTKPVWAHQTQNFWAPHVVAHAGGYTMYFAAQVDNPPGQDGFHMALGTATATSPAGPFQPTATPLEVEDGFAAIDPFVMTDPASGKLYMFWGSGFQPIRMRELGPDGLSFAPGSQTVDVLTPRDKPFEHLIEGAWVRQHDGYYYLFYSGDNCCTDTPGVGEPTYAVMVARATSIAGPYERLNGPDGNAQPILHRSDRWLAPGHNAVVADASGRDWIVYHAVDALQRTTPGTKDLRRCMLIDPLEYRDGWPRVANDSPSGSLLPPPSIR